MWQHMAPPQFPLNILTLNDKIIVDRPFSPNRVIREGCSRGVIHGDCDSHPHGLRRFLEWIRSRLW